jgi:hypothetical protein
MQLTTTIVIATNVLVNKSALIRMAAYLPTRYAGLLFLQFRASRIVCFHSSFCDDPGDTLPPSKTLSPAPHPHTFLPW